MVHSIVLDMDQQSELFSIMKTLTYVPFRLTTLSLLMNVRQYDNYSALLSWMMKAYRINKSVYLINELKILDKT